MILHIVKCEQCDAKFKFNPQARPYERNAPEDWYTVFKSKDIQGQEGWHFCSLACLNDWVIYGHSELPPAHLARVGEQGPREKAYFQNAHRE